MLSRQAATVVENSFKNGLITEATGLNFPESACTETFDCEFSFDGSVQRRLGFDFEVNSTAKTIDRHNNVVVTYLWRNVAGNGNVTILVVQIGNKLYFYETSVSGSLSSGAVSSTVTLTPVASAPTTEATEAQFSDGNGLLFVTHPYCEPIRVSYDVTTHTATPTNIILKIRDFEGASADPYAIDERPTATLAALDVNHKYNLYNQGWNTTNLTAWDTSQTTMSSNADIMWRFKDSSDNFDASTASINRITAGNTLSPKGHFILTLSNQDRDTAAGTTGVAATTTSFQRPSTSCFFAGRVFYAGVNYVGFNSKIYFTQVIERPEQYGQCYQVNDPTSEDLFDLLPTDGGVISVAEAGTIYKLITIPSGIAIFAANGIWYITGSTGLGFTANDYTVQKISTIHTISASSFVDVAGFPSWWNAEGIYGLSLGQSGPTVQSMTIGKIQSFFDTIPVLSKKFAKGFYHPLEKSIIWLFRNTETSQVTETYEYDRILKFNTLTGAFYPWRITDSSVKVNAIAVTDTISGNVSVDNVIDGSSNNVIDGSSNQVVTFTGTGTTSAPLDKFLVSYPSGGSHNFTFAETNNNDYLDWFQYDTIGENFDSYFITGYKLRGEGLRKFQSNWVRIFSRITDLENIAYYFKGIWDYAISGSTGRWSSKQYVTHLDTNYSTSSRRLKVRGHGIALQFQVESVDGQPFDIIGWSTLDTGNTLP